MNGRQAAEHVRSLLKAAGAVLVRRNGTHEIWHFPNGAMYPIPIYSRNYGAPRILKNIEAQIRRLSVSESLCGGRIK